jgi:Flp pilus assembly protein TadB
MNNKLESERIVISAPLSFVGSYQRIWKITEADNVALRWAVLVPIALCLIFTTWMIVAVWYFIMYILFGILFIPFRLWRRGSRKNKRDELRHREVLDAIKNKTN